MELDITPERLMHLNQLSVKELMTFRLLFDQIDPPQDIEQDLRDLYVYPERLHDSYIDEWRAFIKRALKAQCESVEGLDIEVLQRVVDRNISEKGEWLSSALALGLETIEHVRAIQEIPNVSAFKHPNSAALHRLIK